MKPSYSEYLVTRGVRLHIRRWGNPQAPKLFMLHGWMDVSASFQFLVDALSDEWQVIAPDARGFGLSDWPVETQGGGQYWFPDYLADLDALIAHYAPVGNVNLVGHSMGANVVCLYAGIRPGRVRRVIDLEGFGMSPSHPSEYPGCARAWLDQLTDPPQLRAYPSLDDVAARLVKTNPRLPETRARFLARHWSRPDGQGGYQLLGDPAHKQHGPLLYHLEEVLAAWSQVRAKVLHMEAAESKDLRRFAGPLPIDEFKQRFNAFPDWREVIIGDSGHMLHHDQPERVAALIDAFCQHS